MADPQYTLEFRLECSEDTCDEDYSTSAAAADSSGEESDEGAAQDESYFRSYSRTGIHRSMIQDSVRTLAYRKAIQEKAYLFRGKVVLDVGCGTGILSLFAAKVS